MLQYPSSPAGHGRGQRCPGSPWRQSPLLAALAFAACGPGSLAEADGNRLTVEATARLIADYSTVPGDSQVVRVVAELWVDYTLLAAHLEENAAMASLDVALVTEQPLNEIMLGRLREEAVLVDTVVTDQELTARFATEMPGAHATASQILLLFPRGATARQRDSVRVVAEGLHAQLAAGADFASLAGRYSDDPGSGPRGGSMGTFERGEMLGPVDDAVFGLRPGQLSDPVETAIGYHLLRLDALEVPDIAEVGGEFRRRIQEERIAEAEAAYVNGLASASGLVLTGDALAIARSLATTTPSSLSRGAARRSLVTWDGGTYSTGDFVQVFENAPAGFAESVATASDEELEAALRQLGQERLLVDEARSRGFAPTEAETDSVANDARAVIVGWAEAIGLVPGTGAEEGDSMADPGPDSPDSPAIAPPPAVPATAASTRSAGVAGTAGGGALIRVISGEQQIVPLGGVTFLLRNQGSWNIREARIGATVARIAEILSP